MTRDPQRLGDYLAHMLEAIERIEEYVSDVDEMAFLDSWPSIPSCHFHRRISCAMRLRMDISRWTLKSSGRPSTATYRACMP